MKVNIELDVSKPIIPGLFLKMDDMKPVWVSFKYEKLPIVVTSVVCLPMKLKDVRFI